MFLFTIGIHIIRVPQDNGGNNKPLIMIVLLHEKYSCIIGLLWGESTGHWWIPLTKGQ